jgi:hypothetical protein
MRALIRSVALAASLLVASVMVPGCSSGTENEPAKPETGNMGGPTGKMDTGKMGGPMGKMDTGKMGGPMGKMDTGKMGGAMDKMDTGKMEPPK